MKQISGYVLVKETDSGVPNLVVTAYDTEKSIQEIIGINPAGGNSLFGNFGKRLGSVLTNQDGRFVLRSEELEYAGNEVRPDLLLIIFAPEDIQSMSAPYPLPPEERILYISTVPRADAGAEEAFVIRLLQAQLDFFHITVSMPTNHSNTDVDFVAGAVEGAWNFEYSLRERLSPRLQEEQKRSEKFHAQAEEKTKDFSGIPMYLRDDELINNRLLINGRQALKEHLKVKQDQVVTNGLERLQTRNPVMHLRLSKKDLKDLRLKLKDGKIIGNVESEKLMEKVGALTNGFDLVRKRGLDNPPPEELIQKYLIEKPLPTRTKSNSYKK
jgi:hypothetical protein